MNWWSWPQRTNLWRERTRPRAGSERLSDMSNHDEYRIVINGTQRRLIMRALTNAMADDRRSTDALGPTPEEWMQLIRLFSMTKAAS
jgi:hypothetical protein